MEAFHKIPLVRFVLNSFLVAGSITLGQIVTCSLAAFAFSFLNFKGKNVLFMLVMATMMVPGEATIISNYLTVGSLGLLDTYIVLILPSLTSAMGIFLFRQFYMTFPISLYESAKLDGCGNLRFIVKILMPLTKSAMGAMAVYTFINAWNMYMWPLLVTGSDSKRTVQIGISMLNSVDAQSITLMLAGVVMIIIPSISIFIVGQRGLNQRNVFRSSQGLIPVTEKRIENCMKNEEKKMKKKVIASILAASMAAMALTGCGSGKTTSEAQSATTDETTASAEAGSTADGEEAPDLNQDTKGTTITFWHSMGGVNGEAMDYLVNKFNEENTDGITVEAVYQGEYDDTINKLKSAQIGNMGADLVQIYDIGTRFMIDSGWVIPMQELIDADGYDISQIEPNIAAYYTVNNELYSMPFNSSTPILYYNKDMFEKAGITEVPTSLEGILAIGDDLKTKGGAGEPLALSIYGWYFEQWLCKQGLSYADNGNGRDAAATAVEFDSNGGALNILNEWKALNDADVAPNVGRAGSDTATTDFTSGKAAITLGSTASLKQILQDVNGSFEVGTAYFPTIKDGDEGGVSIGGASLWALNNNDDAKAAATWKFIKFLISPESQAYWNAETGYFPVTTAADEEQTFKDNVAQYPQFQTAIDQLHDSKPQYAGALLSVFPEARQIVETEIENMINGNETPEKAVESMASQINSSIEDYNLVNE